MIRSFTFFLGFLFLSPVTALAEEASKPPFPRAPYRMNLKDYNRALKEKNRAKLFVTRATPTDSSSVVIEKELVLTMTFTRSVDPRTLPPLSKDWSIDSPMGVINSGNLADYGEFEFSYLPQSRNGVSYPPNTLSLRLHKTSDLPLNKSLDWSLNLSSSPLDLLGRQAEDFELTEPYVTWNFRLDPQNRQSPFKGGHYLKFVNKGEVEELFSPLKFDSSQEGDNFRFTFTDGGAPDILPYHAKVLSLQLPSAILNQKKQMELPVSQADISLTEFVYRNVHPPRQRETESESQRWLATGGRILVEPWQNGLRVVRLELEMQVENSELEAKDPEKRTLEGFVYLRE